ncbi:MAG: class I SAM-dependent methyltransferase [Nitrospirales bacterium]
MPANGQAFPCNLNLSHLKKLFEAGENISDYVLRETGDPELAVFLSYEIQAGSYIASIEGEKNTETFRRSMKQFADLFIRLGPRSILEAGVGEGTTLFNIVPFLSDAGTAFQWMGGFDLSLSRILFAQNYGKRKLEDNACSLFTGRIEQIPLADESVDLVFTSHALEPNRGKEGAIIAELYRVARQWLVLREPSFDLGDQQTRDHINRFRYADNIIGTIREGPYDVMEHRLWGYDFNPNNQTAVTVICKSKERKSSNVKSPQFINPITRFGLVQRDGFLYDTQGCVIFPLVSGIPCLLRENALLCANLPEPM